MESAALEGSVSRPGRSDKLSLRAIMTSIPNVECQPIFQYRNLSTEGAERCEDIVTRRQAVGVDAVLSYR